MELRRWKLLIWRGPKIWCWRECGIRLVLRGSGTVRRRFCRLGLDICGRNEPRRRFRLSPRVSARTRRKKEEEEDNFIISKSVGKNTTVLRKINEAQTPIPPAFCLLTPASSQLQIFTPFYLHLLCGDYAPCNESCKS